MSALRFDDVSLVLGGRAVLDRINLDIAEGVRIGVVGANGSGKTLFARIASGLNRPTSGTVSALGRPWIEHGSNGELRRKVGVSLSQNALISDLTGAENIRAALGPLRTSGESRARSKVERALADVGAQDCADQRIDAQSAGERKRVDLARMLVTEPEVLILDDVLVGIDQWGAADLTARLDRLLARRRRALLWLSGDEAATRKMAQVIYKLENGRLIALS